MLALAREEFDVTLIEVGEEGERKIRGLDSWRGMCALFSK